MYYIYMVYMYMVCTVWLVQWSETKWTGLYQGGNLDLRETISQRVYFSRHVCSIIDYRGFRILSLSLFFRLFRASPTAYGSSLARGRIGAVVTSLRHSHSHKQRQMPAESVNYTQLRAMLDPLTHWARPGIKLASSWMLVEFVTTEPQWELA